MELSIVRAIHEGRLLVAPRAQASPRCRCGLEPACNEERRSEHLQERALT